MRLVVDALGGFVRCAAGFARGCAASCAASPLSPPLHHSRALQCPADDTGAGNQALGQVSPHWGRLLTCPNDLFPTPMRNNACKTARRVGSPRRPATWSGRREPRPRHGGREAWRGHPRRKWALPGHNTRKIPPHPHTRYALGAHVVDQRRCGALDNGQGVHEVPVVPVPGVGQVLVPAGPLGQVRVENALGGGGAVRVIYGTTLRSGRSGRSGTRHGVLFARESASPCAHLRWRLVDPQHC